MKLSGQDNGIGTVVGGNVRLQGTLKDSNDITVHGTVEGEVISSKSIQVTETAVIKGPVIGEVVTVAGSVKGSIEAKNKLEIVQSGKVTGSISAGILIIHAGAQFNGKSAMIGEKSEKEEEKSSEPTEDKNDLLDKLVKGQTDKKNQEADKKNEFELE